MDEHGRRNTLFIAATVPAVAQNLTQLISSEPTDAQRGQGDIPEADLGVKNGGPNQDDVLICFNTHERTKITQMDHGDYEHVGFWMILIYCIIMYYLYWACPALSWVLNSSSMFWHLGRVRAACPSDSQCPVAPGGHHTTFSGSWRRSWSDCAVPMRLAIVSLEQFWCKNEERSDNDPFIYIYISSTLLAKLTIVTFGEAFVPPHIVFYTIDWYTDIYIYIYIVCAGKEWSVSAELRYSPGRCQQDIAGQWMHHSSHGLPQGQSECLCCVCRGFWGS